MRTPVVVLIAIALAACATGIQLTGGGTSVQAVSRVDLPSGCRMIGDVSIGLPPDAARPRTDEQLAILMRNKAAEMGGTHVVREMAEERTEGGSTHFVGRGVAYACAEGAAPAAGPDEGADGAGEGTSGGEESTGI